jgi:hypothetical protein
MHTINIYQLNRLLFCHNYHNRFLLRITFNTRLDDKLLAKCEVICLIAQVHCKKLDVFRKILCISDGIVQSVTAKQSLHD